MNPRLFVGISSISRATFLLCLTGLVFGFSANAEQAAAYPKKNPLVGLMFPDDWELKTKNGMLFGNPKDDDSLFISLAPMEAGSADPDAAIKEAKDSIEETFKNVRYGDLEKSENDGVEILHLDAEGEDEDGKANIHLAIIGRPDEKTLFLLEGISTPEGFETHGKAFADILHSIKAPAKKAALQTYSYPDKENPSYTIDFPADWKLEPDSEGAYVESPDKLIAMNVIMIPMSDVAIAIDSMKEKVGAKYESIEWNGGGEPSVEKDEALGLTATFNNGVAVDHGVKYSVNFAQYAKEGGDKFLLLLGQEPLKALEKYGDAIEKIIQSIKVK
jgi:hypothetical protein